MPAAGDLWLPDGCRKELSELVIPGGNVARLRPRPARATGIDRVRDRQARLFGDLGQETLNQLRVAVVGLGGVGSILVELLARLGVGELILIDDDIIDETNLPRLLAADFSDINKPKTDLAARNARRAKPDIRLVVIPERVEGNQAREAISTCDWIFLAADNHSARHWVNATVHQHLIPATQVGVKIQVTPTGNVEQIHAVTRLLIPGDGCMWCNGLVDATELAIDMHPEEERSAARYVTGVPAPSVITLNALASAEAANHLMMAVTGLHHDDSGIDSILHLPRARQRHLQSGRRDASCAWCSSAGSLGRGSQLRAT